MIKSVFIVCLLLGTVLASPAPAKQDTVRTFVIENTAEHADEDAGFKNEKSRSPIDMRTFVIENTVEHYEDFEKYESREVEVVDRGLLEDLLINTIRDMVINQINNILGITTTTTPCGGLIGGGLLCP